MLRLISLWFRKRPRKFAVLIVKPIEDELAEFSEGWL